MSKSTTEQATQVYYSGKDDRIASVVPASQEGNKQDEERIDELTTRDHSNKVSGEKYAVGDMYMVAQINRFLRFHTVSIHKISETALSVIYLTTKERDIIPLGPQVRSLDHLGRGIEIRRVRTPIISGSEKGLPTTQGKGQESSAVLINLNSYTRGMEDTKKEHMSYVNDLNLWEKRSLNRMVLAKWKCAKNNLPYCQEGTVQTTLLEVMCILVSITVIGLVRLPEDTI